MAERIDLTIEQGATFFLQFRWRGESETEPGTPGDPVNLTNSQIRMQVRKAQQSPVLLEASDDDFISHDGIGGIITVKVPDSVTSQATVKSAKYDLEVRLANGDLHRVLEGNVKFKPNMTQDAGEPVLS